MATPQWKVYRGKEYVASCKYASDAFVLCGHDSITTVRYGHGLVVWTTVTDWLPYMTADKADDLMRQRVSDKWHAVNKGLGLELED